jgi:phenylacetic acid degradation operon negative regulatory protein
VPPQTSQSLAGSTPSASLPGERTQARTLPRSQSGSAPQHVLVTLLGDYWVEAQQPLPLATLVDLLAEFGIGATSARAAVSRLSHRGVLTPSKIGRNAFYELAPDMPDAFAIGAHGILAFGRQESAWDGRWTLALFALNERHRDQRYAVYSQLRALGFAPLYDGNWVSPRPVDDQVRQLFAQLGITSVTVFRADEIPVDGGRRPADAWDLDELSTAYRRFIQTHAPVRSETRDGSVSPVQALRIRTAIMDDWRTIPDADPRLPAALLPADWPRREAFDLFAEVYDELAPLAAMRVRELVARHSPDLAVLVRPRTTDELLELGRLALARKTRRPSCPAATDGPDWASPAVLGSTALPPPSP